MGVVAGRGSCIANMGMLVRDALSFRCVASFRAASRSHRRYRLCVPTEHPHRGCEATEEEAVGGHVEDAMGYAVVSDFPNCSPPVLARLFMPFLWPGIAVLCRKKVNEKMRYKEVVKIVRKSDGVASLPSPPLLEHAAAHS